MSDCGVVKFDEVAPPATDDAPVVERAVKRAGEEQYLARPVLFPGDARWNPRT
jgi:hypothetical protein